MDFELRITGKTDSVLGQWHDAEDFLHYFRRQLGYFPPSYEMKVELVEEPAKESSDTLVLNDHCDKACTIDGDVVRVAHISNVFDTVIEGFPVEVGDDGTYILYENVFNDNEMPKGWDDVRAYREYEENQLTPWLKSMAFTDICWAMGESDSFGPLSRVAKMRRGQHRFEFIYG